MGFTRYWQLTSAVDESAYQLALAEIRALVTASPVPLKGPTGEGEPLLSQGVMLNGESATDAAGETFALPPDPARLGDLGWCKTGWKPYDLVVAASLAVLADRLGTAVRVFSDGDDADWEDGVQFASSALGRTIQPPLPLGRSSEAASDRPTAQVGSTAQRTWQFRSREQCVLTITFEHLAEGLRQGLAIEARGGNLVVLGQTMRQTEIFADWAGERVELTLHPNTPEMTVTVWNVWEDHAGVPHVHTGHSGMLVTGDAQQTFLCCSVDGETMDFGSMRAVITVQGG